MTALTPQPQLLKLRPYIPGKRSIHGHPNPIKLSSNESSYGPSPAALAAYQQAGQQLHRYPDESQLDLRQAIAKTLGLKLESIVCGSGSEELIQLLVRAYLGPGDEALISENGFVMSEIHCTVQGAELVRAPERDYRLDVEALLDRVTPKTRFCTIANPNNPTGTYISGDELRRLQAGLPENCLLLIDSAYAEYVTKEDYEAGESLVNEFDNVVMTRTFSKIYGLSSLRIGWAYCPPSIIARIQQIRSPFNTNGPALAAATAAMRDIAYIEEVRRHNADWLQRIETTLTAIGIEVVPSATNFYLIRFADGSDKSGTQAALFLHSRGIIPRPAGNSDQFLRITVGLDQENERVLEALTDYMNS